MPEIIQYVRPGGKFRFLYPKEAEHSTVAFNLTGGQAAQLAVALINAVDKCAKGTSIHLTAYRKSKRWTVNIVKG